MGGPAVEGTYPHWPSVATGLRAPQDPVANVQLSRRSASRNSFGSLPKLSPWYLGRPPHESFLWRPVAA
jgi:hypothetical protein